MMLMIMTTGMTMTTIGDHHCGQDHLMTDKLDIAWQ